MSTTRYIFNFSIFLVDKAEEAMEDDKDTLAVGAEAVPVAGAGVALTAGAGFAREAGSCAGVGAARGRSAAPTA